MPVGDRSSRQANLLSQVWTWAAGDISDNAIFKGDFEASLRAIKARTIILPVELDRYFFPPVDAEHEAKHIPNGECRVVGPHGADEPSRCSGDRRRIVRIAAD